MERSNRLREEQEKSQTETAPNRQQRSVIGEFSFWKIDFFYF